MKKVLLALTISACSFGLVSSASAQQGGIGGLGVGATGALVATVVVLGIAASGDDAAATTTGTGN